MVVASVDVEKTMMEIFSRLFRNEFLAVERNILLSWDVEPNYEEIIANSDVVYLSGGNTSEFAQNINQSNLRKSILRHVGNQKLLIGASSGSILMTNKYKDENPSLGLVKFDVVSHYSDDMDSELLENSMINPAPIYALTDGSAIIIDGYKERMLGTIYLFSKGEKALVTCNC